MLVTDNLINYYDLIEKMNASIERYVYRAVSTSNNYLNL